MLAGRLIISRRFVQVRTPPKHRSTHMRINPTWRKWLDEIPVYPQEWFAYHKRPFWHVLCLKRIGLPCCILVTIIVTCSLQIILLSNYSLLTISALADITLLKNTCHFLLLLIGFDTLTYRKELQLIPYTCGSSRLFSGAVVGEWSVFGKCNLVRNIYIVCYNLLPLVTMENNPLRGLFKVSSPRPEPQLFTPQPTAPTEK